MARFLLLTAARRTEAFEMTWAELEGTEWTLPAARNKTKLDLVRPLSAAAMAVLAERQKDADPFVFRKGSLSAFKKEFDQVCGVTGWTLHDLRRTARSLMSRTGVPSDHAERCLGHVIGGIRSVYDRHQYLAEMALAYEKLAMLIETIVNPQPNVVAIRQ
jgi:integrase